MEKRGSESVLICLFSQAWEELFQKNGYDFNVCNSVRDVLYNTDVITYC